MEQTITQIALELLEPHPGNPNKMSQQVLRKLVSHISKTGIYEPIAVRKNPDISGSYQIINGHHRVLALKELGRNVADCVVWDVTDEQVNMFLLTLNRLGGRDDLYKKSDLIKRLSEKLKQRELAKLLPHSSEQIDRLRNIERPLVMNRSKGCATIANPIVFFLSDAQTARLDAALCRAQDKSIEPTAIRKANALIKVLDFYCANQSEAI